MILLATNFIVKMSSNDHSRATPLVPKAVTDFLPPFMAALVHVLNVCIFTLVFKLPFSYIFGQRSSVILKLGTLIFLWIPRSYALLDNYLGPDLLDWKSNDAPNGPSPVTRKTFARLAIFFVTSIWMTEDMRGFFVAIYFVTKPALFAMLSLALLYLTVRILWQTKLPTLSWLPALAPYSQYWIASIYAISLWRYPFAFTTFLSLCVLVQTVWPGPNTSSERIATLWVKLPWAILYFVIGTPFTYFWGFRQILKVPYWHAQRSIQQKCHSYFRAHSAQEAREVYSYTSLGLGEIRILEIDRNPETQEIECRLRHTKLVEAGLYDAISYTWGKEKPTHGLIIDSCKWISVRSNAYELLQDRATTTGTRRLWIDCLCINQEDLAEKEVQIPMMAEIYKNAKRTIVWLGDTPDAQPALSLLLDLADRPWNVNFPQEASDFAKVSWAYSQRPMGSSTFEQMDIRFGALARLLLNDWFYRIWILQEIIFSTQIHIRAGGVWIDWELFSTVMKLFSDPQTQLLVGRGMLLLRMKKQRNYLRKVFLLAHARDVELSRRRTGQQRPKLCHLITNLWKAEATNSLDMIYGLLNLCQDGGDPVFAPKYDTSPETLYLNYAHICLQRGELQETLYVAGIGYKRSLGIPSWVPDWAPLPMVAPLRDKRYNASRNTKRDFRLVSSDVLAVTGTVIYQIVQITSRSFSSANFCRMQTHMTTMEECGREIEAQNMAGALPRDYEGGLLHGVQFSKEAFWRILIGDAAAAPVQTQRRNTAAELGLSTYSFELRCERPAPSEFGKLYDAECELRARRYPRLRPKDYIDEDVLTGLKKSSGDYSLLQAEPSLLLQNDNRFTDAFGSASSGRKFAITEHTVTKQKRMALVPPETKEKDLICVMYGLEVPFVLRRLNKPTTGNCFQLVGECYVHGIMDGEALNDGSEQEILLL
jgi:Heterokaryon incompatibility protein (HET)